MKPLHRNAATLMVLIFLGLFCYAAVQWRTVINREATNQIGMTLWFANQANFEAQRTTLALYQLADAVEDDAGVTSAQAATRFEILLSRVELLRDPNQAAQIAQIEVGPQLRKVAETLERIDQLLAPPTPQSAAIALPLQREAADGLHEIAIKTAIADRITRQETGIARQRASQLLMVSALGILLSGLIMAMMMMYSLRGARTAQAALALHRDALEVRINERTAELERALEQERRAKEVYRGFIVTVSHQFRTPLAIIDMIVKRLVRADCDQTSPKAKAKLERVLESSRRLTDLVNSFIETANVDTDPKDFQLEDLLLLPSLQQVLASFRHRYPERAFLLEASPEAGEVEIRGDAKLLNRAFSNIVQNAINFSDSTKPVTILVEIELDSIHVTVRDQGMGIPKEAQSQVFTPYYRAENAHVLPGIGMGLSHSREIIRAHQGDISLHSKQDVGSDVTIILPLPGRKIDVECP